MNGQMNPIRIRRGRTERVTVYLPYPVKGDEITSQIRVAASRDSHLIATWTVDLNEDGTKIYLTLDDSITTDIAESAGYMDLKRVTGGEPVQLLDHPLLVEISDPVTA